MWKYSLEIVFFIVLFTGVSCQRQNLVKQALEQTAIPIKNYVFWPNATVPFYVNPNHYDHEQSLAILSALSMFAFRTCIKFLPVMAPPSSNEHVMLFENTDGVRRCIFDIKGHSVFEPHRVVLGYDCLQSPQIDMLIMRTLGFPFEHNRISRDIYIDVLDENIEPGFIDLFTKESTQPMELRAMPYDANSVMHFGPRDFSKNGHRTILFKDPNLQQNRLGLTKTDLKKIDIVYGPECRTRDRQEKIELCQSYPGVARKKRDVGPTTDMSHESLEIFRKKRDIELGTDMSQRPEIDRKKRDVEEVVTKSLRVNPDITPPPIILDNTLKELGIDEAVQDVVDHVHKVSALALRNARQKYCNENESKPILRTVEVKEREGTDVLGIIEVIANYAQGMVSNAVVNLTTFCEESESIDIYQRARCGWNDGSERCRQSYRSTKSGAVKQYTQHRPVYVQPTRVAGHNKNIYDRVFRSGNNTDEATTEPVNSGERRKRETDARDMEDIENTDKKEHDERDSGIKRNEKEISDNKEEKAEKKIRSEDDERAEESQENDQRRGNTVLRSGTTIPPFKVNRYEPLRRQGRRNRVQTTEGNEEMDYSSVSMETEKPTKHHRQSDEEDIEWDHKKTTQYEELTKQIQSNEKENKGKRRKTTQYKEKHRKTTQYQEPIKHHRQSDVDDVDVEDKKWKRRKTTQEEQWKTKRIKKKDRDEIKSESDDELTKEKEYTTKRYKRPKKEQIEEIPQIVKLSKANEEFYNDRKWPGGVVRYIITEDTTYDTNDLRHRIEEVNDILQRSTCVKLKEITEDQAKKYTDYIVIDYSPDYVTGRVGGRQRFGSIELYRGDQHRQHTAMMVMAMLGFYFEVSRHDRDKYVRVHMRHVRPDKLHHFEMIRKDATLPLPYDYGSATHPAWQYWRQIGKTGISTVATYKQQDPDGTIMKSLGQNSKLLSDIDIVKINSVYGDKCLHKERSAVKEPEKSSKRKLWQNEKATIAM